MVKINLVLEATENNLENLVLYEPIDINIFDKLLRTDLINEDKPDWKEYDQLIKYKNNIKNGMAKVEYVRSDFMEFGRVNPKEALGLHNIRREVRHTLAKNTFIDIDIENCHPVLLYQVCKENNIDCDYLEEYVINRNKYLKEVMETYNVDRDKAKKLFIIIMYFGGFNSWADEFNIKGEPTKNLIRFKKEVQEIGKVIYDNNDEIKKNVKKRKNEQKKKDYNEIGSVVSYYLQELECRILENIYNYCSRNNIIKNKIAVLCADGLMIQKENYKPELLNIFSDITKKKFGFDLKFVVKDMNNDYLDILDDHILTEDDLISKQMGGYDNTINFDKSKDFQISILNELFENDLNELGSEKYIEFFHHTKSFIYFNYYHAHFYLSNKIHKIHNNVIVSYSDFDKTFNELHFIHNKLTYKFTTLYDKSKFKNNYSTFDFEPNRKDKNDTFNLFRGFLYDSENNNYDEDIIKPYLDHLRFLVSNDSKQNELYEYILNWMAHVIQKPEEKTEVAIVFYSLIEGAGKNILFDIYAELLSGYTAKFRDTGSLTDKFNGEMMGKLFCIGDEIKAKAQEVANELKDIITRKKEIIEFKGKDKIYIRDYKNYAFTTNNENVFKVDNSDRRFTFIECPDEKKSSEYFKVLVDFIHNKDKLTNLFNYFKSRDISNFNPKTIIINDYKQRLMLANAPAYIKFIKDEYDNYSDEYLTTEQLYKKSIEYAKYNKLNSSYTQDLFNKQFKKIFGDFQKKKNNKALYYFPDDCKNKLSDCINNNFLNF